MGDNHKEVTVFLVLGANSSSCIKVHELKEQGLDLVQGKVKKREKYSVIVWRDQFFLLGGGIPTCERFRVSITQGDKLLC